MKLDIQNRTDIALLISTFYTKARADDLLGHIFNEVAQVNWETHLPIMYDFWETTLFHKAKYRGRPIELHKALHKKSPLTAVHFQRWIQLFEQTTDELFEGEKADLAKVRAVSIATVMQVKIYNSLNII